MTVVAPYSSAGARDRDEETPLLGNSGSPGKSSNAPRPLGALKRHLSEDVSRSWTDAVLLFCYVVTGLLDSSAVFIWGSFVSMQTGNTIYLGLGLVAPSENIRWVKALSAIASFAVGSFCFSRFHRHFSPRARWVLVLSYLFQLVCIALAASIVTLSDESADHELHWKVLVPLIAVAFQASGQGVTSRALKFPGISSVVITSNYIDLFSDPNILAWDNVERNRRLGAPVMLLLGSMLGGVFAHSSVGLAGALWTAVGLKGLVVIAWLFWPSSESNEEHHF